ncbi:hypothetical protein JMN32_00925 [Fulvivirga sp. 29W222]|uniref:Uncharacterized protein n=1 Tax=Fulvivirga marina TaxID=2494733 RepID=A0A937FSV8_9BACT|nr:hypothetical protein [Fulvivirga marina]MBL6444850.1 hypothetical protein [Fulvivirga marina]
MAKDKTSKRKKIASIDKLSTEVNSNSSPVCFANSNEIRNEFKDYGHKG